MTGSHDPRALTYGIARLPQHLSADETDALVIELSLDEVGVITDASATIHLPGYEAMLRSLLCGREIGSIDDAARQLQSRLRGPLLRPTLAALSNALTNYRHGQPSGEAAG